MNKLNELESESIFLLREAYFKYDKLGILWSIGKDSTVLLWLIKKAFFGNVPFKVIHIDTTYKFPEMYSFRDKIAKEWNLDLHISINQKALDNGVKCCMDDEMTCCHELKTKGLKKAIEELELQGLMVGIRRDEHGVRAKERLVSPRKNDMQWDYKNQPLEMWNIFTKQENVRIHPLLNWTEIDIWNYIKRENIPVNELYFSKNGKRYRSLGCKFATTPIDSQAKNVDEIISELQNTKSDERHGRKQDKEKIMQRLRSMGYM